MKINCKGKTILIVDDDFNSLLLFSELLLESGAKVLTAIDGKSTLDIVEKQKIDLILLDIRLPDMDGFELLKIIHSFQPCLLAIAHTALEGDFSRNYKQAGFNEFISKPFRMDQFYKKIEALLCL